MKEKIIRLNTKQMCEALGGIHQSTLSGYIREKIIPKPLKVRVKGSSRYYENSWEESAVEIAKENIKNRNKKTEIGRSSVKEHSPKRSTMDIINSVFK